MKTSYLIVGCGRSGTHLLGEILSSSTQIVGTAKDYTAKEKTPYPIHKIRACARQLIYFPNTYASCFPEIVRLYKKCMEISSPNNYIDKTHGLLWVAPQLAEKLPNLKFLGIERDPYPCIASLLFRNSAMRTVRGSDNWREYPLPMLAGGITHTIAKRYNTLCMGERAALVWLAHRERMRVCSRKLSNRMLVLRYEEIIQNLTREIRKLEKFTGKVLPVKVNLRKNENQKFKKELKPGVRKKIHALLNNEEIIEDVRQMAGNVLI